MRKIQKLLLVLCLSAEACTSLSAQDGWREELPNVIPESPNTSSLGIYGQIPVGHYTGVPNISFPLYELTMDGKSFPITLSYHASGIKVAQEASWVGLGWALQAGGCINREIRGLDDLEKWGYIWGDQTNMFLEYNGSKEHRVGRYYFLSSGAHLTDPEYYNYRWYVQGDLDSEPDIFFFNFCGYSVECYFPRNAPITDGFATPIMRNPKEYLDIKYHVADKRWVVTDTKGFSYYFNSKEITQPHSKTIQACSDQSNYNGVPTNQEVIMSHISAWYLDSIVGPSQRSIQFEYEMDHIATVAQRSETAYAQGPDGILLEYSKQPAHLDPHVYGWKDFLRISSSLTSSTIEQLRLSKITYENIAVFFKTATRYDLREYGAPFTAGKPEVTEMKAALDKIEIAYGSMYDMASGNWWEFAPNVFKTYQFEYSYFGTPNSFKSCRLKLDSFYEKDGNQKNNVYKFEYNTSVHLPAKNSHAVDHWGYYNGREGKIPCWQYNGSTDSRLPSIKVGTKMEYVGISKESNPRTIDAAMLTAVQYPTGGKTCFEYETHRLDGYRGPFQNMYNGGLRISRIYDQTDGKTYNERKYEYAGGTLMDRVLIQAQVGFRQPEYGGPGGALSAIDYLFMNYYSTGPLIYTSTSDIIPPRANSAGSIIGYSKVTEYLIDWEGDEDGKNVYHFRNKRNRLSEDFPLEDEDLYLDEWFFVPGFPTIPSLDNGLPIRTEYYDRSGKMYKKVEYDYNKLDKSYYDPQEVWPFKAFLPQFMERAAFVRYYPLKSEWWLLDKVTTTEYANTISSKQVEEYTYEKRFKLLTAQSTTYYGASGKQGDSYSTVYRYPFDVEGNNTVYANMVKRNYINYPIEVLQTKNNNIIRGTLTMYDLFDNQYLPLKRYNLKLENVQNLPSFNHYNGTSVNELYGDPSIIFKRYDAKGNVFECETPDDGVLHTFLWTCNGYHLAAYFKNVAYETLYELIGDLRFSQLYVNHSGSYILFIENMIRQLPKDTDFKLFAYKTFVGLESITDVRGIRETYTYDSFGRLIETRDHNNNILNLIQYHLYHEK